MGYYKVTYNPVGWKSYQVIEAGQMADSKWHAIELAHSKREADYPERKLYKAKLLK